MTTKLLAKAAAKGITGTGALWLALRTAAYAQVPGPIQNGVNAAAPENAPSDLLAVVKNIITVILFIVGFIAVVMLIIGGVRFVISAGNEQQVTGARNTIMYAIIGLVFAILAYAAVNFIFNALEGNPDGGEAALRFLLGRYT